MSVQEISLETPKKILKSDSASAISCWVVTDGTAGMENQCLGLAETLGVQATIKHVRLRTPWKQLSPFFRIILSRAYAPNSDPVQKPYPRLMILSGRAAVPAAILARRESGTFTVHIHNPVIDPSLFDLVVVPRHDGLLGANIMTTRGGLNRITAERLASEAALFAPGWTALPRPWIAVMIGGSNSVYQMTPREMKPIAETLAALARQSGGSLLVTPSRRTGKENLALLQAALADVPSYIWDGTGPNPYFGMLGGADALAVTCDSVNMVSEACTTGKPVYVIDLPGGSEKFRRFHQVLRDDGLTRPLGPTLESWSYAPLNDVQLVAARVREMMAARGLLLV